MLTRTLAILAVCCANLTAQCTWSTPPQQYVGPTAGARPAMAFDSTRARLVVFAGGQTWEWDSTKWTPGAPSVQPLATPDDVMVYDGGRGRCVLFGSTSATWEWDGTTWRKVPTPSAPPARQRFAMTFDAGSGRAVLFGGLVGATPLADTWLYDGVQWTQVFPALAPPARYAHAMAHHAPSNRTVLFGGVDTAVLGDAWSFDGAMWTQIAAPALTTLPQNFAMLYDPLRQVVVVHGGHAAGSQTSLLWTMAEWNGLAWTITTPANLPAHSHSLAFDGPRGRWLLFGGMNSAAFGLSSLPLNDLWDWDRSQWRLASAVCPLRREDARLVYSELDQECLLFGGISWGDMDDTWVWDGARWSPRFSAVRPPARSAHGLVYDSARRRVLLFGGVANYLPLGDTWQWDASGWTRLTSATSPPAARCAMAFDAARGRTVLVVAAQSSSETWEHDGVAWSRAALAAEPPPVNGAHMAYDAARRRMLLFGFFGQAAPIGGTIECWEYDGSAWLRRAPATLPFLSYRQAMAFDPVRGRVVHYGGNSLGAVSNSMYEWDGNDWVGINYAGFGRNAYQHCMAFDVRRQALVLYGGYGHYSPYAEVSEAVTNNPAVFTRYGSGCAGSGGVPLLGASEYSRPWLADTLSGTVVRLPLQSALTLVLGAARTQIDLAALGMPGCAALTSLEVALPLTPSGGNATWSLTVPNDRALAGRSLFGQAVVRDPAANLLGLTVSNGGEARLGAR